MAKRTPKVVQVVKDGVSDEAAPHECEPVVVETLEMAHEGRQGLEPVGEPRKLGQSSTPPPRGQTLQVAEPTGLVVDLTSAESVEAKLDERAAVKAPNPPLTH